MMHTLGGSPDSLSKVQSFFWASLLSIANHRGHENLVCPDDRRRQTPTGNVGRPLDVVLFVPGVGQACVVFSDTIRVGSAEPGRIVLTRGLALRGCDCDFIGNLE